MLELPAAVAAVVASYVVGSLPFGLLLAKAVAGVDPRTRGSGNVGATNVARVVGRKWFPVVVALDAAKGAVPPLFLAPLAGSDPHWDGLLAAACAGAAVSGHVWSLFLKFRGGKGVATTAGALAALAPLPLVGSLAVFGIVLAAFDVMSLASVAAAVAMPLLTWWNDDPSAVLWFSGTIAVLIVIRHHSNLYRVLRGTEPRFRGATSPTEAEEHERA